MADKEKLQEERKTGGPKMLRPGLGQQTRRPQGKKKKKDFFIVIDDKYMSDPKKFGMEEIVIMNPEKKAKGGRVGLKSGSKGCKLAMKGKGRAYGKNS